MNILVAIKVPNFKHQIDSEIPRYKINYKIFFALTTVSKRVTNGT